MCLSLHVLQTGDDTAHFQATTRDLSVPHLMCRRTEGTSTTARRCCGVFRDSGAEYKTADLLTYYGSQSSHTGKHPSAAELIKFWK